MDHMYIPIETERTILRPIGLEDVEHIWTHFTAVVAEYMFPAPSKTREGVEEFVRTSMRENEEGSNVQLVIESKQYGEFLGCCGVHHSDTPTPEFGIWLKEAAFGLGYGKEVILALKEWADHHLDYTYLLYPVDIRNHASKRIAELLGATVARTYQEESMSGRMLEIAEYRVGRG